MSHEYAWTRLPDLLFDRDDPRLIAHLAACHDCQRRLFLLGRVDRLLRATAAERRREHRRRGRRLRLPAGLAAAAAAALALLLLVPQHVSARAFTMRLVGGQTVGRAVLGDAGTSKPTLTLVASGLPTRAGTTYVLWAGEEAHATTVGRFMVDVHGSCRAQFDLPAGRSFARFWVTLPDDPTRIVART